MMHDEVPFTTIERCRSFLRKASTEISSRGVENVDVAIGAVYAAHDAAVVLHSGDQQAAIEWQRTALDLMERQLLDGREGA